MAFGRNAKGKGIADEQEINTQEVKSMEPATASQKILAALREGPKTPEELMEIIGAKAKTAMFGQIAVLNTRGLNKREARLEDGNEEAAQTALDFPVKGEDGKYALCTYDEWIASKVASKPKKPAKVYTAEEMLANAQKRCVKTDKAMKSARAKAEANPDDAIYAMKADIAEKNHILSVELLTAVEAGIYKYEKGAVAE